MGWETLFTVRSTSAPRPSFSQAVPSLAESSSRWSVSRPTLFFSVPTSYAALLATEGSYDFSSVRQGVSAGEALPPAIFERFKDRFGVEILDGIGSTEILHIFISNRRGQARPGSSGRMITAMSRLIDDDGHEVPTGEIGNLLIKGDSTCSQYWNRHQQTARTIAWRVDQNWRQVLPGRGRVLLVRRTIGRHAQGRRDLGLAD